MTATLIILISSLLLNLIFIGVGILLIRSSRRIRRELETTPATGHPAIDAKAVADAIAEAVDRVKKDTAFRAEVLALIPSGEHRRLTFATLCRTFANQLDLPSKATSKILIHLCQTEHVIRTDGQSYWK